MNNRRTSRLGVVLGAVIFSQALIACTQTSEVPPAASTSVIAATEVTVATARPVATYVVQRGDRLVDIAAEQNIPLGVLLKLNDIPNPDVIEIGDVIRLEAEPSAQVDAASEAGEAADVGVAAGPPVATSTPLPRIVQVEPVEQSFSERLSEWWGDAPKPALSGDAVQQGIFAAVALPAAVVALVLLLIVGRLAVRLLRGATRFALNLGGRSGSTDGEERSESGENEDGLKRGLRLPSFAFVGHGARGIASATGALGSRMRAMGIGWLTRPVSALIGATVQGARWVGMLTVSGVRAIGRLLHLNARKAVGAHSARRDRARDQEFQRESRGWWSQGRERLRIGLLDEAEECFETGLRLAVEGGWQDEIALYRSELQLLEERRNVERSLVPSAH